MYDDYIKFSLEGDLAFHKGELIGLEIGGYLEYYLGDELMLFLGNQSGRVPPDYQKNVAHDELYIVKMWHGKKDIESGTVRFGYLNPEKRMYRIKFPLVPAVNLAQANVSNKEVALELEDEIKTLVTLGAKEITDSLITRLTEQSKRITKEPEKDKTD